MLLDSSRVKVEHHPEHCQSQWHPAAYQRERPRFEHGWRSPSPWPSHALGRFTPELTRLSGGEGIFISRDAGEGRRPNLVETRPRNLDRLTRMSAEQEALFTPDIVRARPQLSPSVTRSAVTCNLTPVPIRVSHCIGSECHHDGGVRLSGLP